MSQPTYLRFSKRSRWFSVFVVIVMLSVFLGNMLNPAYVRADVSFSKSFSPDTIGPGSTTALSFTISNTDPTPMTNLAFTDDLPADVFIATPANVTSDCDSAVSAPDGGTAIAVDIGRLGANTSCEITMDVTSSVTGTHTNTTSPLTSDAGAHGVAVADLSVVSTLPGFSKSFSPATISPGGTSRLTFVIDNTANGSDLGVLQFTDTLPDGMFVASPANASTDCGHAAIPPTLSAEPGTNSLYFSANAFLPSYPSLAGGASCSVIVDVTVSESGEYANISSELLLDYTTSAGKASAILSAPRKFLIKSFTDDPVAPGDTTTLEFTLTNLDRSNVVTDITFSDDLDAVLAGLTAVGLPLDPPCGAGSQLTGDSVLTLTGGNLPAQGSCTFSATLQVPAAAAAGTYTNTTSGVTAWINGDTAVYDPATDYLFVTPAPRLTKTFDDPVATGDAVTLTFTITNTSPISPATDIAFDDELTKIFPYPLSVTLPSPGFCGPSSAMVFTFPDVDRQAISMTGGELGAGDACTFSVAIDVPVGMAAGTYYNVTDNISAVVDGITVEGQPAVDDLVIVAAPSLHKSFDDPVRPGDLVTLTFTLAHDEFAPADATDIAFTDNLAATLADLTAVGLPQYDICGAGSELIGTDTLSFTGGSLVPGEVCTLTVPLQVPMSAALGDHTNTTSAVTANVSGLATTGGAATDDLTIASLSFYKRFLDDPAIIPGDTVILEFEIINESSTYTATNIAFSDDMGDVLAGLNPIGLPQDDVCGSGSQLLVIGADLLYFTGGSLDPDTSCTFSATLSVPAAASSGIYDNSTSNPSFQMNGSTLIVAPAMDALTISSEWLSLSKTFINDPVAPGETVDVEFTLTNVHPTHTISSITFNDDLDAVISDWSAVGLPSSNVCGVGSELSGTTQITLTNGTLVPGASCMFVATLLVPDDAGGGIYNNTTSRPTGIADGLTVDGLVASDSIQVTGLRFAKAFSGPTTASGEVTLTFTITNIYSDTAVTQLSFLDDLEAVVPGLVATQLPATPCGSGSTLTGDSLLTFTEGNLPAEDFCTFDVVLQVPITATPGSYVNTTSDLTSAGLFMLDAVTDTLVIEPPPVFTKQFIPDAIFSGQTSTLQFTVDNTASVLGADGLDFVDNLPTGIVIAAPLSAATTCTGGTLTAVAGTDVITYTGGSVAAGESCTVWADVASITPGVYLNTTDNLLSTSGDSGEASDTLTVTAMADLSIVKAVAPDPVAADATLTYTLTISNAGINDAASVVVTDTYPTAFTPVGNTCGASGTPLVWSLATLAVDAIETCTITGTVAPGTSGTLTNTATIMSAIADLNPTNNTMTVTNTAYDNHFSINDVSQDEGDSGETLINFTLSRTDNIVASSVDYETADGTAIAGDDYVAVSPTTVNFAEGGPLTHTVAMTVTGDITYEWDETFTVTLSNPMYGTIDDVQGIGTILNDDPEPQLSVNDTSAAEDSGLITFTVSLDVASDVDVSVTYSTTANTATDGDDFTGVMGSVDILAGQIAVEVAVPLLPDLISEPDETFTMTLSSPVNATLLDAMGTGTIRDDEARPFLTIQDVTVDEAATNAILTVTLSAGSAFDVSVNYMSVDDSATAGEDYTATSGVLTLLPGQTSMSMTVPILDDALYEMDETFTVTLHSPVNADLGSPSSAVVTLVDDDPLPDVALGAATYSVDEAAGLATVTVTLSAISGLDVPVNYATTDGTAIAGDDYTAVSDVLTVAAGQISNTFTVAILDDVLYETDETFSLTLSAPVNANLGTPDSATVTVVDDETTPDIVLSAAAYSVAEVDAAATFTVTLSTPSVWDVSVNYASTNDTALAGEDYTAVSGILTITAGETSNTFIVPILDDTLNETAETFTLTLSSPVNANLGSPAVATVTVLDDDAMPTVAFEAATYSIVESAAEATIAVTLTAASDLDVAVDYATIDNTALAGEDYTAVSGTLLLSAGQTGITFTVPIFDDALLEGNESLTVTLSAPVNALLGAPASATLVIVDDESEPVITNFDLTVQPDNLLANGLDQATLTVTATDEFGDGAPFAGRVVTFAWTLGFEPGPVTATLDTQGVATTIYTVGHMTGTAVVTATVANVDAVVSDTVNLTLYANPLAGRFWSVSGPEIVYTFVVSNTDDVNIQENVVMTGSIPANTVLISTTASITSTVGGEYGWGYVQTPSTSLMPGEYLTLTWTVRPLSLMGDITNRARASSNTAQLRLALTDRFYHVFLPSVLRNVSVTTK